ncbi:MAG: hypothetical protein EOP11_12665 [Proteobacteria bacterium]|nr:MAG: hypothetical protein EOP11_12665 [Pseudomonadota bacterium]
MMRRRGLPLWKLTFGAYALPVTLAALSSPASAQIPVAAQELTQQNSQHQNASTNAHGSDDSIDEATNNAMKAFMNLAALNIPGAISKGYQAYGNYLNSEKMDDLEARSKVNRGSMSSIVNGLANAGKGAGAGLGNGNSSGVSGKVYGQMDTGFLYKGATAETAAEFEQKTGMKREDFFKHMAAGLDSHPTWDDPQLMQKLEGRFNEFKNAVPNKEFREGLSAAQNSIPDFARNKIMGEIAGFYAQANEGWKKLGGNETAVASNVSPAAAADASRTPAAAGGAANPSAASTLMAMAAPTLEKIAATVASGKPTAATGRDTDGLFIGLKNGDSAGAIKDFLSSPVNLANEQDSLFKTVSKRYRLLTPSLLGMGVGKSKL